MPPIHQGRPLRTLAKRLHPPARRLDVPLSTMGTLEEQAMLAVLAAIGTTANATAQPTAHCEDQATG